MKRKIVAYLAAVVAVWFVGTMRAGVAQVPKYTVIDLGTLGGRSSSATGINNNGQVVGYSKTQSERKHAFLYSNGVMQDLGTLEGESSSYARGINNKGEVVGYSETRVGDGRAFFYSNGIMQDLSTLVGWNSYGYGINNHSQAVGGFLTQSREHRTFLYSPDGSVKDFGTFGGTWSEARGINDNGQVVGDFSTALGDKNIFLYSPDGSVKDLGILGRITSAARGINNKGEVVGWSVIRGKLGILSSRAFLYSNGVMQDIGTLEGRDSYAYGINNHGQVVGAIEWFGDWGREGLAFLYSNGITMDLNDLIDKGSGWQLYEATAINDRGQIVGRGRNPSDKGRAFLLNPIAPDWRNVIENQPVQPTYTEPPKKDVAKDSLVVVTHGWIPKEDGQKSPPDPLWVDEMVKAIRQDLESRGLNNWQVEPYKWTNAAWLTKLRMITGTLLDNADKEGVNLGNHLKTNKWKHIHFIGHSAGAAVIQTASEITRKQDKEVTFHTTFLDAYVGFKYNGRSKYGVGSDWSDSYFARDPETFDSLFSRTEGHLDHAYGVDITWLEPNKKTIAVNRSANGITGTVPCLYTVTTHEWPREFYLKTIPPETTIGAEKFGFPLSKEGGGWNLATKTYPVEINSPYIKVLGRPDSDCISLGENSMPVYSGSTVEFNKVQTVRSATGIIQNNGSGLILTSGGKLQQQSLQGIRKTAAAASETAWIVSSITVTNSVSIVSFDAQFLSANAEGLLTTYWDTNSIGSIDERVVLPGLLHYTYALPSIATNGSYTLGFRLDSFSDTASSMAITNVAFGFIGIREPLVLSVIGTDANSSYIFSLTGPSGYNYRVESSTNLLDWSTIAILVNTNGIVNFSDPSSTNTNRRFYRAAVP